MTKEVQMASVPNEYLNKLIELEEFILDNRNNDMYSLNNLVEKFDL